MEGKVSIWLGRFGSEGELNTYVAERYNEAGDVVCPFYTDFQIEYLDSQFREVAYNEPLTKAFLLNASYAESFASMIIADLSKYNAIILAYNFAHHNRVRSANGLHFYGVLEYRK